MSTRRTFLTDLTKIAGGAAVGYISLPLLEACMPTSAPLVPPPTTVPIGPDGKVSVDASALSQANPAIVAPNVQGLDGFGVILTLTPDGTVHAFSMKCTHQSCPVDNRLVNDEVHCSCHGSLFRLDGTVDVGPATIPLTSYPVKYDPSTHIASIQLIVK